MTEMPNTMSQHVSQVKINQINSNNVSIPREFQFQNKGFHICNLNIKHVKPKLDNINLILSSSNNVDIQGLCETFLNQNTDNSILNMQGYHIERKDRDQCHLITPDDGGGILVYIANHLNYTRRNDLESQNVESIWLEIKLKNSKSFLVCSVYRPPSAKSEWIDFFSEQIDKALTES